MKRSKEIPLVSGALVAINVLVYLACMFAGDVLYGAGMLDVRSVLGYKEYGRILWAMFLHGSTSHIFNNMLILFFLGAMIEKEIGHIWFAFLYFLSGISGNLLSLYVKARNGIVAGSVGASGAIFGLDGVLLAMVLFRGKKMENVTPTRVMLMILLSLYSGYTSGNVDNAAHLGGLMAGFAAGSLMCAVWKKKNGSQEASGEY
ncbi:MAG: rhomboid family intramembrane serine protease [Lachnospiraceae bacterium]|nr:rhomboid family intramembrane serine protease [Lachnospiraceae bacterium]MCM1238386.1 rhomboid family intramembrane serine protease [Lachnospiraceae bacterium]MCM1303552.1 rhomboid family intramembrane serine protease [Butyrivibrio sp.]MCM1343276.1 rhomboid family intramembrane serine protease [Muribaculaceae bacterium]MCM1409308.1 rhomboid family intramembrane serine protease [Lachnospiraceae bacterium]